MQRERQKSTALAACIACWCIFCAAIAFGSWRHIFASILASLPFIAVALVWHGEDKPKAANDATGGDDAALVQAPEV